MSRTVYINGRRVSPRNASISVFDHGFLYGFSVYETFRVYERRPWLMDEHVERLFRSSSALGLAVPWSRKRLRTLLLRAAREAPFSEASGRLILTRGVAETGLEASGSGHPTVILMLKEFKGYPARCYSHGVRVEIVRTVRNPPEALDPAIKTGNFLNNILAFQEAQRSGAFEGIMMNGKGFLTEGTTSNLFICSQARLLTPSEDSGILSGITRSLVMNLAKDLGIATLEKEIRPADLENADEAFLTSSLKEIMPVVACRDCKIGDGKPGSLTRTLLNAYRDRVRRNLP